MMKGTTDEYSEYIIQPLESKSSTPNSDFPQLSSRSRSQEGGKLSVKKSKIYETEVEGKQKSKASKRSVSSKP